MDETAGDQRPQSAGRLIAEILELAERFREQLDEPCEQRGLSGSRFAVLRVIGQCGEAGCSQTELADQLNLSGSNVSALVEGLRKSGLLFRFRCKVDRRRSVLLLTESGREILTVLGEARRAVARSLVGRLNSTQITELRRLLGQLGEPSGGSKDSRDEVEMRRAS